MDTINYYVFLGVLSTLNFSFFYLFRNKIPLYIRMIISYVILSICFVIFRPDELSDSDKIIEYMKYEIQSTRLIFLMLIASLSYFKE